MFEVGPGELLDLIDKGDEIGFRIRGGSVHPSSVSLGIKHGGARVEKRNIKEFLQEFRGGAETDEEEADETDGSDEEPGNVDSVTVSPHEPVEDEPAEDEVSGARENTEPAPEEDDEEKAWAEVDLGTTEEERHVRFESESRLESNPTLEIEDNIVAAPDELEDA